MPPLPIEGRSADWIRDRLDALSREDVDWRSGRAFSLAYSAGPEVQALTDEVLTRFQSSNALNVAAFPSLRVMQAEIVDMVSSLLHLPESGGGFVTSGGTESILCAVKAARNLARARGLMAPEMVLPTSAHAAFEKAAADYDVRSVRVPVGADWRADPAAMLAAINPRTALLVASAPSYPQGVVDPIGEIAALAAAHEIPLHVDACMGGMTLPMLERLGRAVPAFDFRLPGVTSISVDLHKYGYTAKGASVVLYRDRALRRHQTFVTENWLGGAYGSASILGTRSGGPIAAAWAVLQHLGLEGYLRLTAAARLATEELVLGLRALPEIRILAEPDATLVAFACDGAGPKAALDAWAVGDALWRRGWVVDQQKPPPSLHCTVNAVHHDKVSIFLEALRAALGEVRASGSSGPGRDYSTVE